MSKPPPTLARMATPYLSRVVALLESASEQPPLPDVAAELSDALRHFEHQALRHCGDPAVVTQASYLLCTFADELLIAHRGLSWSRCSLLVQHHTAAHGGEQCWDALETWMNVPPDERSALQLELLGLYEQVIALGLRGRYRLLADGEALVHQWRLRLHHVLHAHDLQAFQTRQLIALATQNLQTRARHTLVLVLTLAVVGLLIAVWRVDVVLSRQWQELSARMALEWPTGAAMHDAPHSPPPAPRQGLQR